MSSVSGHIQALNSTINAFESGVDVHVNSVHKSSVRMENASKEIYTRIMRFREDMEHGEQRQLAHENVIRIDQIMKERFGQYETIRRTVMGVVRDFDINLVRNSTVQELSEELWLTSSRYWLSYALIAITAWVNNYPEVATTSLAECGRKDAVKTTLFFCLLNMRFERMDAAKKWFYEYLKTLDPAMLQMEAAVMLQAFLDGIFGRDKEMEFEVIQVIDQWIAIINENAEICNELVSSYEKYIANINPKKSFDYVGVLQYCSNAEELSKTFTDVSKFDILLQQLEELDVDAVEQTDENYKARVDAVLMELISNFDAEERELRNEQEYFNLIIQNEGKVEIAEAQYQEEMAVQNEHFNIGKQMINWALYDDNANIQVRKFAFQNTKGWFRTAIEHFVTQIQRERPIEYHLAIDTWTGTSNGSDLSEQVDSMRNYYEANKLQNMFVNELNIAAAIAFAVSIGFAFVTIYSLVITVIAAIFLGFRVYKAIQEYPKRIQASLEALQLTMAEISDFQTYYETNLQKQEDIFTKTEFI